MDEQAAPHLELTVILPREASTVPVVRRLAGQTLEALGVRRDDVEDVQLAITEACANVIKHATESDTYEVKVDLGPERCSITVLDRGAGFDSTLGDGVPDDAETGRGLRLIRAVVDSVNFEQQPLEGSLVHMVKELSYHDHNPLERPSA
jgi:serine/threonine-protein kinase RsbW